MGEAPRGFSALHLLKPFDLFLQSAKDRIPNTFAIRLDVRVRKADHSPIS